MYSYNLSSSSPLLLLLLPLLSVSLSFPSQSSQIASGSLVARIESYRKRPDITFDFALRVVTMHRTVNEYDLLNSIFSYLYGKHLMSASIVTPRFHTMPINVHTYL